MNAGSPIIGIRDSGVGGLTVATRIRQLLPHARLLYFADTAHVPYGERTPAEVRHYALSISRFLIEQSAAIVVFACNTSSAYALDLARGRFTTPIIGMIEPGARAALAATTGGPIGVLATQATVNSGVYTRCLQALAPGTPCVEIACPEFVPLVESEQTVSPAAEAAARRYLQPMLDAGARTVILGCTHYPLLLPVLRAVALQLDYIDPAAAVADEVAAQLRQLALPTAAASSDIYYVSGESEGVAHWVRKLMPVGDGTADIRRGPVFDLPIHDFVPCEELEHATQ